MSMGNDEADFLANIARKSFLGKRTEIVTCDPGGIYLTFNGTIQVGGIKSDLKKIQRKLWEKKWKTLKTQGLTLKKHRSTYPNLQKVVKTYAIESGNEKNLVLLHYFNS